MSFMLVASEDELSAALAESESQAAEVEDVEMASQPRSQGSQGSEGSSQAMATSQETVSGEPRAVRNWRSDEFIENTAKRGEKFKRRSKVILESARNLQLTTGAEVSVFLKYEGTRKTQIIRYPDVEQQQGAVGVSAGRGGLDSAMVKSVVKEGGKEVLDAVAWTTPRAPVDPLAGYSSAEDTSDHSMDSFSSSISQGSRAASRRASDPRACFVCKSNTNQVPEKFTFVESAFLKCAVEACPGQCHYDCLGFPHLGPKDELKGKWYCNAHVGVGRTLMPGGTTTVQVTAGTSRGLPTLTPAPATRGARKPGRPPLTSRAAGTRGSDKDDKEKAGGKPASTRKGRTKK